ncbi:MAG: zinc-binding dehydrogenase [Clostridia bacterium]|nr:zinc-binding dehydrogenase [Clostridia bacterium]
MTNKAMFLMAPGVVELCDIELPAIQPDEVLVKSQFSAISAGTELANFNDLPNTVRRYPRSFGYNAVGIVTEVGSAVKGFAVGDRVLCYFAGGHRLYSVCKRHMLCKIPNGVDMRDAALVIIGGFGLEGARMTKCEIGESALVVGCGLLGQFALQALRCMGATPVVAIDFNEERLAIAKECGADYAFRPDDPDLKEKVMEATEGRGFNCAVEVTGSAQALVTALGLMARRGRIALTGCTRVSDVPIDFYKLVHVPGIQLLGAHTSVRPNGDNIPGYWVPHSDHRTLLRHIAKGNINVKPLWNEEFNPADCTKVYSDLAQSKNPPLGNLFNWDLLGE